MADRTLANLHIQPLFTEVLNGEFTPPSDLQARKHTASKLLVDTYLQGDEDDLREDERALIDTSGVSGVVRYFPRWARHVESSVFIRNEHNAPHLQIAAGLALRSSDIVLGMGFDISGTSLSLTRDTRGREVIPITISAGTEYNFLLTQEIQRFFDRTQV